MTLSNVSNTFWNGSQSCSSKCCLWAKVIAGDTPWLFRICIYVTLAKVNAESIPLWRHSLSSFNVIFNLVFRKNQLLNKNCLQMLYSANPLQWIIYMADKRAVAGALLLRTNTLCFMEKYPVINIQWPVNNRHHYKNSELDGPFEQLDHSAGFCDPIPSLHLVNKHLYSDYLSAANTFLYLFYI